jgi:translation initiation factor 3 subunit G
VAVRCTHGPVLTLLCLQAQEKGDNEDAFGHLQGQKNIKCRICGGDHWTKQCPHQNQFSNLTAVREEKERGAAAAGASAGAAESAGGKYIPPSMRAGATGERRTMRSMEDACSLRVSNLHSEATEEELRDLFGQYGRIMRVFVAIDRDRNLCKVRARLCVLRCIWH